MPGEAEGEGGVAEFFPKCITPSNGGRGGVLYTDGKMPPPPTALDFDFGRGPPARRTGCVHVSEERGSLTFASRALDDDKNS